MDVILLVDVKGVGKKNDTVKVSDGYANNFLIPKHLAVISTTKSIEILENQKEQERLAHEKAKKEAHELSKSLENIVLTFSTKVGKDGKLFGGISLKQVVEEMEKKNNIILDKRKFVDKGPLNSLGFYKLNIELYKGVTGVVTVHIIEEK